MKKTKNLLIILAAICTIITLIVLLFSCEGEQEPQPTHPGWNESQKLGSGDRLGERIHGATSE